jgi:hypothetical protein
VIEHDGPWIGDLVHDPVAGRNATLSDVVGGTTYVLRAAGSAEWTAEDPARLEVVTRRADRDDWPLLGPQVQRIP